MKMEDRVKWFNDTKASLEKDIYVAKEGKKLNIFQKTINEHNRFLQYFSEEQRTVLNTYFTSTQKDQIIMPTDITELLNISLVETHEIFAILEQSDIVEKRWYYYCQNCQSWDPDYFNSLDEVMDRACKCGSILRAPDVANRNFGDALIAYRVLIDCKHSTLR